MCCGSAERLLEEHSQRVHAGGNLDRDPAGVHLDEQYLPDSPGRVVTASDPAERAPLHVPERGDLACGLREDVEALLEVVVVSVENQGLAEHRPQGELLPGIAEMVAGNRR